MVFTPADSGTAAAPITYAAYPGEQPVLSGGRAITGWQQWRGKITCASLPVEVGPSARSSPTVSARSAPVIRPITRLEQVE